MWLRGRWAPTEAAAVGNHRTAPPALPSLASAAQSQGVLRHGRGRRLGPDGRARLVGVARVPPTGDALLDAFLQLPTDALAVLSAELTFA